MRLNPQYVYFIGVGGKLNLTFVATIMFPNWLQPQIGESPLCIRHSLSLSGEVGNILFLKRLFLMSPVMNDTGVRCGALFIRENSQHYNSSQVDRHATDHTLSWGHYHKSRRPHRR